MAPIVDANGNAVNLLSRTQRRVQERRQREAHERRVREEAGLAGPMDEAARQAAEKMVQERVDARAAEVVGREKGKHRDYQDDTEAQEKCARCQTHQRVMFSFDGSWTRFLVTLYGVLCLRLPRIRCDCGALIRVEYEDFEPYARRHAGIRQQALALVGMCLSLRQVGLVLGSQGVQISRSTVAQELGSLVDRSGERFSKENPGPGCVLLDGVWVSVAVETGQSIQTKSGRQHKQKRVRKLPLLIAWGIWPDTGKAALVGWMLGNAEDAASWQRLLEKLWEQGVCAGNGTRLFVHDGSMGLQAAREMVCFGGVRWQRCIFHKVRNVLEAVQGDPQAPKAQRRERKKERRQEMATDLAAIWAAPNEDAARQQEGAFIAKWQAREPGAVAALQNDFTATLSFYQVQAEVEAATGQRWEARLLRTTSPLERKNRTLRAKARSATIFQTEQGLLNAMELTLACRGADNATQLAARLASLPRRPRPLSPPKTAGVST